jgi:hypothetical protein
MHAYAHIMDYPSPALTGGAFLFLRYIGIT